MFVLVKIRLLTRLWFSPSHTRLSTCGPAAVWAQCSFCPLPSATAHYPPPPGWPSPRLCEPSGPPHERDMLYSAASLLQPETHTQGSVWTTRRVHLHQEARSPLNTGWEKKLYKNKIISILLNITLNCRNHSFSKETSLSPPLSPLSLNRPPKHAVTLVGGNREWMEGKSHERMQCSALIGSCDKSRLLRSCTFTNQSE